MQRQRGCWFLFMLRQRLDGEVGVATVYDTDLDKEQRQANRRTPLSPHGSSERSRGRDDPSVQF